jgi:ABC-type Fe3+ transport system permease subunit
MVAWFGETFYWTATVIAGLLLAWVLWSYGFNGAEGGRTILIVPLLLAAIIWLTGWACRKALE